MIISYSGSEIFDCSTEARKKSRLLNSRSKRILPAIQSRKIDLDQHTKSEMSIASVSNKRCRTLSPIQYERIQSPYSDCHPVGLLQNDPNTEFIKQREHHAQEDSVLQQQKAVFVAVNDVEVEEESKLAAFEANEQCRSLNQKLVHLKAEAMRKCNTRMRHIDLHCLNFSRN